MNIFTIYMICLIVIALHTLKVNFFLQINEQEKFIIQYILELTLYLALMNFIVYFIPRGKN